MSVFIISDAHLGSPAFNNKDKLLNIIKKVGKDDELVIAGDFYDLLGFKSKDQIEKEYKTLLDALKNIKVTIIKGNHDADVSLLDEYSFNLPNGKKVIVIHGHKFDTKTNAFLVKLDFFIYGLCGIELRRIFKPLKSYKTVIDKTLAYYKDKCDFLIMGHTHSLWVKDSISINAPLVALSCGDILEHCSYVEINENKVSVLSE